MSIVDKVKPFSESAISIHDDNQLRYSFVALDVETPNYKNDSICQLGLTVVENGLIKLTESILINPEAEFSFRNTEIHGISEKGIKDKPTFPQVWEKYRELFTNSLLVAHNASFDLTVLSKCCSRYQIDCPDLYYICTCSCAKEVIPDIADKKLLTLCDFFDIQLNHHDAASDSEACALILLEFLNICPTLIDDSLSKFSMSPISDVRSQAPAINSTKTIALQTLQGILIGITCDNVLTPDEVYALQSWLKSNQNLIGQYPFDKVYSSISDALEDGFLSNSELTSLLNIFKRLTNPVDNFDSCCSESQTHELNFVGKNVCLTGDFTYGSKQEISSILASNGAILQNSVTKQTDILVVGGCGSDKWTNGTYGGKIKRAMEYKDKGIDIQIIKECEISYLLEGVLCVSR